MSRSVLGLDAVRRDVFVAPSRLAREAEVELDGSVDEDADAVHWHLTSFALVESEDQDPDMHVRSQAAYLAADWLRLFTGRELRVDEELFDEPEPVDLSDMVSTLAWTRSRQVSARPEDFDELIDDLPDEGHEPVTLIVELRTMRDDLPET